MLLDGKQLGPVCCVLPLLSPRSPIHTDASDPARTHIAQVCISLYLLCHAHTAKYQHVCDQSINMLEFVVKFAGKVMRADADGILSMTYFAFYRVCSFVSASIVCLLQENAAVHEGLFLAATLGGMLVARVTPDGRFNVLHNLARPPDAREGCLPYPTWRLRTPAKSSSPTK